MCKWMLFFFFSIFLFPWNSEWMYAWVSSAFFREWQTERQRKEKQSLGKWKLNYRCFHTSINGNINPHTHIHSHKAHVKCLKSRSRQTQQVLSTPNTGINDELRKSRFSITCFCVCAVCVGVKHIYECLVFQGALRLKDGHLLFISR